MEELAETLRTIRPQLVSTAGSKVAEREAIMLAVEETAWEAAILRGRENSLGEERRRLRDGEKETRRFSLSRSKRSTCCSGG